MAGNDDPIVPPANARILAMLIPKSTLKIVDDGHLFAVTRPLETAETVRDFLEEPYPAEG
jgi:pimeloyl-ACP methyl ester carboxylesterase